MKKQSKIVVFVKHLHSCFASFSSNDEFIYTETVKSRLKFDILEGSIIKTKVKSLSHLNGEKISEVIENNKILKIYVENDNSYYKVGSFHNHASKEQMDTLVKSYTDKGWSSEEPDVLDILQKQEGQIEVMHRENLGYIIPEWSKDITPEQYQGGLSDKLVNVPVLKDYLKSGGCHGYIGSSSRTYAIDRFLEQFLLRKGFKLEIIAEFMTWKQGRHFADQLDGDRFEDAKNTILNDSIGYVQSVVESMKKETV